MNPIDPRMQPGAEPAAILLVEDDAGLVELVLHQLQKVKPPTRAVKSGQEALAYLMGQPDALVLLDYSLPDMTASALLAELGRAGLQPPFIVMTGHGDERIAVEMMKQGARDYLIKDLHFLERLPAVVDRVMREVVNERRLLASEQRFRAIFEGSEDALVILDQDGFVDCNARALILFGYDSKELLLKRHPAEISPPSQPDGQDSWHAAKALIASAFRSGSVQFEWIHKRRNGELFPAEVLLSAFEVGANNLLQATIRDVTDRKRAEETLRESRERYRQLVHVSPDAIMVHQEGRFIYVNPAACRLLGATQQTDLIGRTVVDHVHPDYRGVARERIRQITELGQSAPALEEVLIRLDGTFVEAEVVGTSMTYNGAPAVQVIARDISDRKRAERALAEQDRQRSTLLGNLPGMVYRCRNDRDWTMEFVSDGCLGLTGYPAKAVVNNTEVSYNALIHPADQDRIWDEVQAAIQADRPFRINYRIRSREGMEKWVWEAGTAVKKPNGEIEALEGFITDVTDLKRAEMAAAENERRFRQVIGNATAAYFRVDAQGRFEHVNEAWLRLHVYDRADAILGRSLDTVQTPESLPQMREQARRLLRGDSVMPGETSHRRSDGTTGYHAYSMWPVLQDGNPVGFEGFLIDTTDLRQARADYQMLFARMIDGFALHKLICDEHGKPVDYRFLAINPAFERLTHLKADQVVGRRLSEVLPHEDPFWVETYGRVVLTGESKFLEHRSTALDRIFEVSAFRTGPMEFASVFVDITEHRQAEAALKTSREELLSIYENAPVMMVVLDAERRVRRINRAMSEFITRSEEEAEGLRAGELLNCIHSHDDPIGCGFGPGCLSCALREMVQDTHSTGSVHQRVALKARLMMEHGVRDVHLLASSARIPSEDRPLVLLCLEDVTRQSHSEEQIRQQAALLNITHDAILVLDLDGRVQFWNRSAEKLYGWRASEILGQPGESFLGERGTIGLPQLLKSVLESGEWIGELQQADRDRRPLTVQCRASLVSDEAGTPRSVLIVATDITETKSLEAKFLRAQRLESIGALASGIAHDLNNVLAPLSVWLPLARQQLPSNEDQVMIGMMESGVKRGSAIIKQLLMFGRGAEGARTRVRPKDAISEMVSIINETFPKSIKLSVDVEPDLPGIVVDPTQLHQVLMNLCVNARDAMEPKGGTLTLAARLVDVTEPVARAFKAANHGPCVAFEVSDTGSGISPENVERIFDPFFTTKDLGKGTGLGLSTVQGIVRSHGGFVDLVSELGRGTTFRVFLPTGDVTAHESLHSPQGSLAIQGKGELILVIDDEASILKVVTRSLQTVGYSVLTAENGAEGLRLFDQNCTRVRGVIVDMMMPTLDGAATIRVLRERSPGLFVVGMSGLPQMEAELRAAAEHDYAFLPKPFPIEDLLEILANHVHLEHCGPGKGPLG